MCNCKKFQCTRIEKTKLREIKICVCGHPLTSHKIGLFKESCNGIISSTVLI